MKLRNKKTGGIAEPFGITCINGRTFVQFDDGKGTFKFEARSLSELNEEWEDYEEPEEYWYISAYGNLAKTDVMTDLHRGAEEIGNLFGTREEAEKAVEKLKAWKRLKDKGFDFEYVEGYKNLCGNGFELPITATMPPEAYTDVEVSKDLDLLFGGEKW